MFEDLTKKINLQNIGTLRAQHSKTRYPNPSSQSPEQPPQQDDDEDDNSLDDLYVEVQERKQNFQKMINNGGEDQEQYNFLKRNDRTPEHQRTIRKLNNQLELSYEKQKMIQKSHKRQMEYQQQLYKRRQQWLTTQISRLKAIVNRGKKDDREIKELKKQNIQLTQLIEIMQQRLNEGETQMQSLKQKIEWYEQGERIRINQGIEIQLAMADKGDRKVNQTCKIKDLQYEIVEYKRMCSQKEKKIDQVYKELKKTQDLLDNRQRQNREVIIRSQEQFKKREQSLESQIISLRKRNQSLQETFIQKMSQITKIQAHMFTNINQSVSYSHKISQSAYKKDPTLTLQQVSPIKPSPNNFSEKKRTRNSSQRHQNPQAGTRNRIYSKVEDGRQDRVCQCCEDKIEKLKNKLACANHKLVELLEQKAKVKRYENKNSQTEGRTRILSWINRAA